MFATGFAIFLGLVFIFIKLGRRTMLRILGHDVWLDIGVTMLTLAIHWGSFSGVMAATFAGLLTSAGTTIAKRPPGFSRATEARTKGTQAFVCLVKRQPRLEKTFSANPWNVGGRYW